MKLSQKDTLLVYVSRGSLSKAIGQRARNKELLKNRLGVKNVLFKESCSLPGYSIKLETEIGEKPCI